MGTLGQRSRSEEHLENIEPAPLSNRTDSSISEERGLQRAYAAADRRWVKAMQGAVFTESRQAQKPEPKFRRQSPMQYGQGSSLL